ncbi:hypothetical protein D3C87_1165610 [compost metagenome]
MNLFKSLVFVLSFGLASAHAADVGGITANGEISFDYNFLSTGNQTTAMPNVGGATNEAYRLNTAQILLKKETEQISFLSRLAYSQVNIDSTDSATGTTTARQNMGTLDQVEIFYKVNPSLQIGFGRFLTTLGYESLLKGENATYGNTIAYQTLVPGYGEGLRAKYTLNEYFTATASTYNRAKFSQWAEDYSPTKATEVSVTGTVAGFTWFAGYLFGKDGADAPATGTTEIASGDAWVSYKFMDNLSLAITYDSLTKNENDAGTNWSDSASAILTYGWGMNNFALRYEMVRGAMHIGYGAADVVNSITLTDKIVLNENLNFYVEYRADQADEDSFVDTDGEATKNASIVTLGALARF